MNTGWPELWGIRNNLVAQLDSPGALQDDIRARIRQLDAQIGFIVQDGGVYYNPDQLAYLVSCPEKDAVNFLDGAPGEVVQLVMGRRHV